MEWNDMRNNTSFVTEVNNFFKTVERDDILRYHQELIVKYFERFPVRGLLLFHKMGMGKSLLAAAITNYLMEHSDADAIFISAKTLHLNFDQTVKKFTKLTGKEFNGDIRYVSMNASNMMTQVDEASLTTLEGYFAKRTDMHGSLDGKIIIIDEAHNLFNSIANGSENATKLYTSIMKSDCRLIFLSGSPITNDPFEAAICFNMLTGTTIFPESYTDFTNYFVGKENGIKQLKNPGKFANRINGLISFYDAHAITSTVSEDFPTELPLKIVDCIMSKYQYNQYFNARKSEVEQQLKRKKGKIREHNLQKTKAGNGSYRVASRNISNFAFPEYAIVRERNERGTLVDRHYSEKLDADELFKNMNIYSPKIVQIIKNAIEQPGIGLIYSQFLESGLNIVALYLDRVDGGKWKNRYTMITGEVDKEEVVKLLNIINSKDNMNGEIFKFVLISGAASEGVDFRNIRHIHIMEPYWHWSRILQIIGRGVRMGSHTDLKKKDQTVQPFMYIAKHGIKGNTEETTDEYLHTKSIKNQQLIDSFYVVMRMSAIDCPMHYKECRKCTTMGKKLFTDDITIDINEADPCADSITLDARIFTYEGDTYASYDKNGEIYFAKLNTETGNYEKVSESLRIILMGVLNGIEKKNKK